MKQKIFGLLQKVGKCFMLPIALLPIAGLFLGLGSCLTNETTISFLHLNTFLYKGTFFYDLLLVLNNVGQVIFHNLPLLFAASIAMGMANKHKGVSILSAIIAYFTMHATIHTLIVAHGTMDSQLPIVVIESMITTVCGMTSLDMGIFGGILVGLGVSYIHNRFYHLQLPEILSFFEGERFIPILSTLVFVIVGLLLFYVWPFIQYGIIQLGTLIASLGYFGTFLYGMIERLLLPFGLHHVFYIPFWQSAIGGTMEVSGELVSGAQNIFFAQLQDPSLLHFSKEATRFLTGKFILMMFGIPGIALAMYHAVLPEHKKQAKSLLASGAFTSFLTGITEPIEFTFLFTCPTLFLIESILAGSAYMIAHLLNITIGLTFSGGVLDFLVFGVLQGNSKTNWILLIFVGIIYFIIFYSVFYYVIKKKQLRVPCFDHNSSLLKSTHVSNEYFDEQCQRIIQGLGGRDNIVDLDCCITRLRVTVHNQNLVSESLLKQSGAAAVMKRGNGVQVIYGPKASSIKTKLEDYLTYVPKRCDLKELILETNSNQDVYFKAMADGEVCSIEEASDHMFANKILGDGFMMKPNQGIILSPCDGTVHMIYPTKHAIGIKMDNGCECLLHFGTDTVSLNGKGFELFVYQNQKIKTGDLLWNADLNYIKEHAQDEYIMCVFTTMDDSLNLDIKYGNKKCGDTIVCIHK